MRIDSHQHFWRLLHLTAAEREAIFGGTAATFYGIGARRRGALA
jgi:predicted TIM-barrel fold metal-dependent hydrolase